MGFATVIGVPTTAKSDLNDVVVFIEVVNEEGSFSAAERKLDLPVSAVNRRVARRERRLGETPLRTTTHRVGVTDVGRVFHDRVATIGAQLSDAERAVAAIHAASHGAIRASPLPTTGAWSGACSVGSS